MANLKSLIRFRSFQVDEKRRVLAALYEEAMRIEQKKTVILDTMSRETKAAKESGSFDVLRALGLYVKGAKARLAALDQDIKRIDLRITIAQDDLRDHFTELKKIEILHERRLQDERDKNAKREAEIMDEIGLTIYNRQDIDQ